MGASVWVNPSQQTVGFQVDDTSVAQTVLFEYTVTVDPPSLANGNATATVFVLIEGTHPGMELGDDCNREENVTSARSFYILICSCKC